MGRRKHPEPLTPAEQRVLQEIRVGGTNAEIAVRLGLSINTVKYHVANMLAKLEIDDRKALAAWRDSGRLSWLRGRAVLLGLAGVASAATIVVIGAVFLAQRAERAPEDQLWWFETKRDAGTANGFHFRELVTGDEQDLDAPAGVMWVAPQWSPDGSRFSALEVRNGDTTAVALHLWTTGGKPVATIAAGRPDQYWWSPNGSYLALASDDLAIVTRDGKVLARTALDIPGVDEYTAGAAWSTDERAFAFLRNGQLTALNRDGSSQRLLLTAVGIDSDLQNFAVGRWLSPDTIEVLHRTSRVEFEAFAARIMGDRFELTPTGPVSFPNLAGPTPDAAKATELEALFPNMDFRGSAASADGRAWVYQFNKPYGIPGETRPATMVAVIGGRGFEFETLTEPTLRALLGDAGLVAVGGWAR